jgi:hypothetical protein
MYRVEDVDGRDKPGHDVNATILHSAERCAAALRKQSRHRQLPPSVGIGNRAVSSAHQHGPAGLQVNSVPQPEQARRREAGFSNRFVMIRTKPRPCF